MDSFQAFIVIFVIICTAGISLLWMQIFENHITVDEIDSVSCTDFADYPDNGWVQKIINEKRVECDRQEMLDLLRELKEK